MSRVAIFVAIAGLALPLFAQMPLSVPPGANYDPARHVNPFITYVDSKDFKPSTYKEAEDATGHPLLGLSKETGSLASVALADLGGKQPKDLKLPFQATFYPVAQQTFKLTGGESLILHSFKPPKVQGGGNAGRSSLGLPFPTPRRNDPKDKRFGPLTQPEQLEIRGLPGLLFEKDGLITVAWMEDGVYYTAAASLSRKTLFEVLDDLL